jgi:hypothetical protein
MPFAINLALAFPRTGTSPVHLEKCGVSMSRTLLTNLNFLVGTVFARVPGIWARRRKPVYFTDLTKNEAEDCLDWLEAHGYRNVRLSCTRDRGFTVSNQ